MMFVLAMSMNDAMAQKMTKVWEKSMEDYTTNNVRGSIAGLGKQVVLPNKNSGKLEVWEGAVLQKEYDINTWVSGQGTIGSVGSNNVITPYGLGLGVATDEVGNIVCNLNPTSSASSQNFVVIPADGSGWFYLPVEIPLPATATRMDYMGRIAGDITKEAYMYLCPSSSNYIAIVKISNGKQDVSDSFALAMDYGFDAESIACPVESMTSSKVPAFVVHTRNQAGLRYSDGTSDPAKIFLDSYGESVVGFDRAATTTAFDVFTIGEETYYLVNRAKDGFRYHDFAVKNLKTGEEVATYVYPSDEPTNYQNALVASVNKDLTANVFHFVPGNRLAMYTFDPEYVDISQDGFKYRVKTGDSRMASVSGCVSSEYIVIPDTLLFNEVKYCVEKIDGLAFSGCGMSSVVIPSGVSEVGSRAFNGCGNLSVVVSLNTTPPACAEDAFADVDMSNCVLYVPKDAYVAYWSDSVWGNFKNIKILYQAESLALDSGVELEINTDFQLAATLAPANVSISELLWESCDSTIVKVNSNGVVEGVAIGKTYVVAKTVDGSNLSDSCEVNVTYIKVDSISLNEKAVRLKKMESFDLICEVLPQNAHFKDIEWNTSDESVAALRVNGDGSVTVLGAGEGNATITASTTDGSNLSATCEVEVYTIKVDSIILSVDFVALEMFGMAELTYTVYPQDAEVQTVTWASSDTSIAMLKVNDDGTATVLGSGLGTATVTATADDGSGVQASCDILVVDDITGVEDVVKDGDSQVEYYDLLGVKVENPSKGVFIKKQGSKTTKVVL